MSKFTYNDIVCVAANPHTQLRSPLRAWIVCVLREADGAGSHPGQLFPGSIYAVEFDDGSFLDVHEQDLEPWGS